MGAGEAPTVDAKMDLVIVSLVARVDETVEAMREVVELADTDGDADGEALIVCDTKDEETDDFVSSVSRADLHEEKAFSFWDVNWA